MSSLGKVTILSVPPFKKYFGIIADPMKNPTNARINVITKLVEGGFNDRMRNIANTNNTINGLKM